VSIFKRIPLKIAYPCAHPFKNDKEFEKKIPLREHFIEENDILYLNKLQREKFLVRNSL
jgi:hypothetical protein